MALNSTTTPATTQVVTHSVITIPLLIGIFVIIMAIGTILILLKRRQMKKSASSMNVVIFVPTGGGIKWITGTGSEVAVNTQKMLDIPVINRKLDYPPPSALINSTAFFIQTDKVTYRPLVIRSPETLSISLKQFKAKLEQEINAPPEADDTGQTAPKQYNLSEKDMKDLYTYLSENKLEPLTDSAYLLIYANNVEKIVMDTALEGEDIWARLAKFMPAIMIVATAVALAILFYAYIPLYNNVASALQGGLHVVCNVGGAANTILPQATTSTIKPPVI